MSVAFQEQHDATMQVLKPKKSMFVVEKQTLTAFMDCIA
jgi:hypothetical protein